MKPVSAIAVVFIGGFVIMVLEIVGARYLARDFGSSFHVWVSQIGVVLIALALGYYVGGALADRFPRAQPLVWLLAPTGAAVITIPDYAPRIIDWIVMRHPAGAPIPAVWQRLDPVLGSALIFLLPCVVLATLAPWMIRITVGTLARVGRSSGGIIAASTVGSIAGVFVSGFVLIEHLRIPTIFRLMGGLTVLLGVLCVVFDSGPRRVSSAVIATSQNA